MLNSSFDLEKFLKTFLTHKIVSRISNIALEILMKTDARDLIVKASFVIHTHFLVH